jgi:hypothetical protein
LEGNHQVISRSINWIKGPCSGEIISLYKHDERNSLTCNSVKLAFCSNLKLLHLCTKLNMGTLDGLDMDYL